MGLGQHNFKLISYIGPEGKLVYSHTSPCRLRIWDHLGVDLVHGRVVAHTGEIDVDLRVVRRKTLRFWTVSSP